MLELPVRAHRPRAHRLILAFAALIAGVAISCERPSPEARIRERIEEAERALADHDAERVMTLVARDYRDEEGRDIHGIERIVRGLLLRYPDISIVTRVNSVLVEPRGRARVEVVAAVAGAAIADWTDLGRADADILRLRLDLELREGGWTLVSSDWERAELADVLP